MIIFHTVFLFMLAYLGCEVVRHVYRGECSVVDFPEGQ